MSDAIASGDSTSISALTIDVPSDATVIAVTDDGSDPRFAPVRELAARVAVSVGGNLLLCVAPPRGETHRAQSRLYFPTRTEGRAHTGTRTRDLLLDEARLLEAPGLTIAAWLPSRPGSAGVAEAVTATGAALVLVAARARRAKVLDRTLDYLASRVPARVVAVAPDGSWQPVRALVGATEFSRQLPAVRPSRLATPAL